MDPAAGLVECEGGCELTSPGSLSEGLRERFSPTGLLDDIQLTLRARVSVQICIYIYACVFTL